MRKSTSHQIRLLCRKRIVASRSEIKKDSWFENRVVQLVAENHCTGRFERLEHAYSKRHRLTLEQYVDNVIRCVILEDERIKGLERGDADHWNRLAEFLRHRALRTVSRFRSGTQANTDALDFAQQTCLIIFEERYPFDVSFEAWATTILNRLILTQYTRNRDALNQPRLPDSLDASPIDKDGSVSLLAENIGNPQSLAPFEKIEVQLDLLDAIDQLSSANQREVIRATFLNELEDAQIAEKLGKTKQAVYNLRKRALSSLRKILAETGTQESASRIHKINRGTLR